MTLILLPGYADALKLAKAANPDFDRESFRLGYLQEQVSLTPGELEEVRFLIKRRYSSETAGRMQ